MEIFEQRGIGVVELREEGVGEVGKNVFVVVPRVEAAGHGHEANSGFDQPSSEQRALA